MLYTIALITWLLALVSIFPGATVVEQLIGYYYSHKIMFAQ